MLIVFLKDCVNKQKLSLQKELDKACVENAKLWAKKLVLIEKTFCFYKKHCAFFSCELCLCKQLGILSEKKKKMFARKLASIENLERSKQGVFESVKPSNAFKVSESMANLFNSLFDLFSPSALAFFINIPQYSGLRLG